MFSVPGPGRAEQGSPIPALGAGKTVLVTGGTGFIGANVVRALLAHGYAVRCTVRESSRRATLEGLPVEIVHARLDDVEQLCEAMEGCHGVQHVAGLLDVSPGGTGRMRAVHVDGTRNLCEAALRTQVQRLVLCSSSVTVGWGTRARPGDEDTPIPDADRAYGRRTGLRSYLDTKLEAEGLIAQYVERGLEGVIVNPDFVIGPWDVKPTSGTIVVASARRWIPVYPKGGKCFIDAGDCAEGHVLAMERGAPGRRYLLGNENHSYRDFMTLVAREVGRAGPVFPIPRLATSALGLAGSVLARVDPERAVGLNRQVLSSMQLGRYRSGARARSELGVPHTPLTASVREALTWFRAHGYLKA